MRTLRNVADIAIFCDESITASGYMQLSSLRRLWLPASFLIAFIAGVHCASCQTYEWTTLAGNTGGVGFRDGAVGVANFNSPKGVASDSAGVVYLTETGNHAVRVISTAGVVSTLAGKGGVAGQADGVGIDARFNNPTGITVDNDRCAYITDTGNHTVRKITPGGIVTTIAGQPGVPGQNDGAGATARFSSPSAITLSPDGDLIVSDTGNHTIRKITPAGVVSTIAGQAGVPGSANGVSGSSLFRSPKGLSFDVEGTLFVADTGNRVIRKMDADGNVTTLAGLAGASGSVDGIGANARFVSPQDLVVDLADHIYVSDLGGRTIRRISTTNGAVGTLAGKPATSGNADGSGADARFSSPLGLALSPGGSVLVADYLNHNFREVTPAGVVTTVAANPSVNRGSVDATGTDARFQSPMELAFGPSGEISLTDAGTVRRISPTGNVTTLAGTAGLNGTSDGTGADARFNSLRGLAIGPEGVLYAADSEFQGTSGLIRKISTDGVVTTLAGMPGTLLPAKSFYLMSGIAVDPLGNVFTSELTCIRKITAAGTASYFAGEGRSIITLSDGSSIAFWESGHTDGNGASALFNVPSGITIDANRNLYVSEMSGNCVRKITPAGTVSTVCGFPVHSTATSGSVDGTGTVARFKGPKSITVDAAGSLYLVDSGNHTIRKVSPSGVVTTIGGIAGYAGCCEGVGDRAAFNDPFGITVDPSGNLYVADSLNYRIVKGTPLPVPEIVVQHPDGSHLASGGPGLDFASVTPSSTSPVQILTIYNTGNAPLMIGNLELVGDAEPNFDFDRSGLPDSIPPLGNGTIRVTFRPRGLGSFDVRLRISSNDSDEPAVDVTLHGLGNTLPVFSGYSVSSPPVSPVSISLAKLLSAATDPDGDKLTVTAVTWPATPGGSLVLQSGSVLFYPSSSNYSGTSTFLATISDSRGGSTSGNVSVAWQSPASYGLAGAATNPPKLTMKPDGTVEVGFHGIPNYPYSIQRSVDLKTWQNMASVIADAAGHVIFVDPAPPNPSAYYRITSP